MTELQRQWCGLIVLALIAAEIAFMLLVAA
jgi:hypothetical protein